MYHDRKISVVMPCLNEEDGIKNVLGRMPAFIDEKVVCDNGSTDNTAKFAKEAGAIVVSELRRGYGRAFKTGITTASGDIIVTMDGDGSYPPEEIEMMLLPLVEGKADFISGTRFPLKFKGAMSTTSRIGNFGLTFWLNVLFLKHIKDSQSGMWAFEKRIYAIIEPESDGMAYSQEIKINAMMEKYRFLEVPITYAPRIGTVKLTWLKDGVINLLSLFKTQLWGRKKRKQS